MRNLISNAARRIVETGASQSATSRKVRRRVGGLDGGYFRFLALLRAYERYLVITAGQASIGRVDSSQRAGCTRLAVFGVCCVGRGPCRIDAGKGRGFCQCFCPLLSIFLLLGISSFSPLATALIAG